MIGTSGAEKNDSLLNGTFAGSLLLNGTFASGLLLNGTFPGGGGGGVAGGGFGGSNFTFSQVPGSSSGGGAEVPSLPPYIRTTSMLLCILILGIGVIGNVMVPLVILKTKDMRNSTNIFLINLSLADLMVLLVCTPTVLVEVNSKPETWVLGEHMCE
ncbi:7 transmembrane receptor (rhodopsin family) [Nesidiocoris tenuis]|uniref:7 transmembrane receptor (Rhodopsin family) n=1 Tax=Nesidiocoris tenuis TaxID=355587 RepID=A0ABN7AXA7_9HEMI|nr:7 transmembrane receptor (rhodopsin family) [Nesidiocoris tenuis]